MSLTAHHVVKAFGALRLGIGVAFALAPKRPSRGEDVLMMRSFAVREAVLGLGGLRAGPRQIRDWARTGALVDVGDVIASVVAVRRRTPMAGPSLVMAALGLGLELWASFQPAASTEAASVVAPHH